MPIEDIDFLKKNSVKQSYLFLVDSKDRNKESYPTPAEYVVQFPTPFHQVIGMNVVDASIPRTMYNIDIYNRDIRFYIHSSNEDLNQLSLSSFQTASLETGDYSIQSLVVELNNKLGGYLNNNSNLPYVHITASTLSNPPDIKNKLVFSCPYPFLLDMGNSSMAETLGFDGYTKQAESLRPEFEREYDPYTIMDYPMITSNLLKTAYLFSKSGDYKSVQDVANALVLSSNVETYPEAYALAQQAFPYATNSQLYHSVDIPYSRMSSNTSLVSSRSYTLFEGPRGVIRMESLANRYVAQRFYSPTITNLNQIYTALYTDQLSPSSITHFTIQKDLNGSPSGISLASGSIAVSYTDGSLSDSTILSLALDASTYYWIVFEPDPDIRIYYNDVLTTGTPMKVKDLTDPTPTWVSFDDTYNDIYYQLSIRVQVCDDYHRIVAPGIYSLVGERYIVLRCKEIEENSFRSLSYSKYSLGIAKFRLGVVGYREERLDYSSVPNREFHPIGKLSRLTLRFETASGQLYDFKDVNHTITFSVQYLEAKGNNEFNKSIINSNYNGDFMKYQYSQQEQEEDSDDQDMDYNRDAFERYKLNEARNLPFQVAQRDIKTYYDLNYPSDEEGEEQNSEED